MTVSLIGSIPYLSACKDKYENDPVVIYTYTDSPIIHTYKNINHGQFNSADGSYNESTRYSYQDAPIISKIIWSDFNNRLKAGGVKDLEIVKGEEIQEPEIPQGSTLATGDHTLWFMRRPDWIQYLEPVLTWNISYQGSRVETFVSRLHPIPLYCMDEIYILVQNAGEGFDVYKLIKSTA